MKLATYRDAVLTRELNEIKTSVFGTSWADFELKLCRCVVLVRVSSKWYRKVYQIF